MGENRAKQKAIHTKRQGIVGKHCRTCKQWFPLTEYHKNPRNSDGYHNECKHCKNLRNKKIYVKKVAEQENARQQKLHQWYPMPKMSLYEISKEGRVRTALHHSAIPFANEVKLLRGKLGTKPYASIIARTPILDPNDIVTYTRTEIIHLWEECVEREKEILESFGRNAHAKEEKNNS